MFGDVISGKTSERPGLAALPDHVRAGDTPAVIRLGRPLGELPGTVDALRARGTDLTGLAERVDTTSAAGGLVFRVFGAIAHFGRRLMSERT